MIECNGCGECCRAVALAYTKKEIRAEKARGEDGQWILKHFRRISKAEAVRRVPGYDGEDGYFYECDAFDPEKNICTMYGERPRMCSGFPWYGKKPEAKGLIDCYPDCSYHADLKTKGETK